MTEVVYLGIRHHGPGSAGRVLSALKKMQPSRVLIEGPADLSEQLQELTKPAMQPPIALLAFADEAHETASFWPLAVFSPEYQAARWALENGKSVQFFDLPFAMRVSLVMEEAKRLAEENDKESEEDAKEEKEAETEEAKVEEAEVEGAEEEEIEDALENENEAAFLMSQDPFTALGKIAGYEDGESYWHDLFEAEMSDLDCFDAVEETMSALREGEETSQSELQREAFMRLEVSKAQKETEGLIAVVCGAWHVPALKAKHSASADRALLKNIKKTKIQTSWVPWTSTRLSIASGYGAGVVAPKWYEHLWDSRGSDNLESVWVAKITRALREAGHLVSTASSIEVIRLSRTLSSMRERPKPGFEEMREASISCLMMGELAPWYEIETPLLLGNDVGTIPEDLPLAPLLADLARQQKLTRLKPEALEKELSIDLRSDSGLKRSTLLHRLTVLGVDWGEITDSGRSRGTFRERWILAWEPEYAVKLVENLVFGVTIETAASAKLSASFGEQNDLAKLADMTLSALTAQLPNAARIGTKRLEQVAIQTEDCLAFLETLPPLVDIIRYGQARAIALKELEGLVRQIMIHAAIALPYATRNLDGENAERYFYWLPKAHQAVQLVNFDADDLATWTRTIQEIGEAETTNRLIAGLAVQICYESELVEGEKIAQQLTRALSAAYSAPEAAAYFEGFFTGAAQRLIYDETLRTTVDTWLLTLDETNLIEALPLFRRVFSKLDKNERRILLEALFGRGKKSLEYRPVANAEEVWEKQLNLLSKLLVEGKHHGS